MLPLVAPFGTNSVTDADVLVPFTPPDTVLIEVSEVAFIDNTPPPPPPPGPSLSFPDIN